jgi:VanZ family protein
MLGFIERNNWIAWVIVVFLAGFIFYISSLSGEPVPQVGFPLKAVIYHLGVFFLFAFFLMIACSRGKEKDWIFFSLIFSVFYGISDELHQYFVPGRHASFGDVFLDFTGIMFAFLIYFISVELRNVKKSKKYIM